MTKNNSTEKEQVMDKENVKIVAMPTEEEPMVVARVQELVDQRLGKMERITLEEMGAIKLMNRMDTKYVVNIATLAEVLVLAREQYRVQTVDEETRSAYRTTYLDTDDLEMYVTHHNGHQTREKIRVRTYVSSGLTFLEVKNKNNKGRTDKKRIKVEGVDKLVREEVEPFFAKVAKYVMDDVSPKLENRFRRITLVNKAMTERLTIDTDIEFHSLRSDKRYALPKIAIIELKRDGRVESPMTSMLNILRVKQMGFSKYCIGTALTNEDVKQNNFKKRLRKIEKLSGAMIDVEKL